MAARRSRTAIAAMLAACSALAGATPALATDVSVEGAALRIADRGSQANALEVAPSLLGYDILDDLTDLTPGPGCVALHAHHVVCSGAVGRIVVDAGGGNDVVALQEVGLPVSADGGEGADLLEGGINDDRLDGGPGQDTVLGAAGDDEITGADGDDLLQGGGGSDRIAGGEDADIVQGQAGSGDVVAGNNGPDLVEGGTGDDELAGGSGADVLVTGSGDDTARTGTGSDRVFGTTGDDVSCSGGDDVRTGSGAPPPGCGRLSIRASRPDVWPPPPAGVREPKPSPHATPIEASGLRVQAALIAAPKPKGLYTARVMHHGNARKLKLRIPWKYDKPVRVRVRTVARNGRSVHTFYANIRAKRWVTIATRRGSKRVWTAKARCCPAP